MTDSSNTTTIRRNTFSLSIIRSAELAIMSLAEHFKLRCYREREDGRERVNCSAKHMQYDELDDLATFV